MKKFIVTMLSLTGLGLVIGSTLTQADDGQESSIGFQAGARPNFFIQEVPYFDFGSQVISNDAIFETTNTSPELKIKDTQSTTGWYLSAQMDKPFSEIDGEDEFVEGGAQILGASIRISNFTFTPSDGPTLPAKTESDGYVDINEGPGIEVFRYLGSSNDMQCSFLGNIVKDDDNVDRNDGVSLVVPSGAIVKPKKYKTTVTWTLTKEPIEIQEGS
jgi:hypothetical protein